MYAYVWWRMRGYQPECHGHATSSSKRQEKTPICHSSYTLLWMNRLEDGTRCDFHTEVSKEDVHLASKEQRATSRKSKRRHRHTLEQTNKKAKAKSETDMDAK